MSVNFTDEQTRHILEQTEAAFQDLPAEELGVTDAFSFKCTSCQVGLRIAVGAPVEALIAAFSAAGGVPTPVIFEAVKAIAKLVKLKDSVILEILQGEDGRKVKSFIKAICKNLKACK